MGILAGALIAATTLPVAVSARQGGGKMNRVATQVQSGDQIRTQQRLRDGSCLTGTASQSGAMTRSGKTYGPGDGTGNQGVGPKDGTGYGAPGNR
jgi:hypothetical protein